MILRFLGMAFNSPFNLLILLFIDSALSGSDCSIEKDNSSIFSFKLFLLLSMSGSCGDTKPMGVNVQIIISDIQSYLPAMRYMLAFNAPDELTWYWDEPTITLDYQEHEYHEILRKNWQENLIPNIILSSATLPKQEDIAPCIQSFVSKFNATNSR